MRFWKCKAQCEWPSCIQAELNCILTYVTLSARGSEASLLADTIGWREMACNGKWKERANARGENRESAIVVASSRVSSPLPLTRRYHHPHFTIRPPLIPHKTFLLHHYYHPLFHCLPNDFSPQEPPVFHVPTTVAATGRPHRSLSLFFSFFLNPTNITSHTEPQRINVHSPSSRTTLGYSI